MNGANNERSNNSHSTSEHDLVREYQHRPRERDQKFTRNGWLLNDAVGCGRNE